MKNTHSDRELERVLREYIQEAMIFHAQVLDAAHPTVQFSTTPTFYEIKPHIFERDYVTKVLGVSLPLNESYPYSAPLHNKIIKEQRLLEDFFQCSDDQIWILVEQEILREQDEESEDESPWSWTSAVRLAGDVKTAAAAMKMMAMDAGKIDVFVDSLWNSIKEPFEKMKEFFEFLSKKGKEWGIKLFQKLGEWAETAWGWIKSAVEKVKSMAGWKKALGMATAAVGIKIAWGKIGELISSGLGKIKEFAGIVDSAKGGEKNESYVHSSGLVAAVYGRDDELNEFFGKKKKDKYAAMVDAMDAEEKEEEGLSDEEKRKRRAQKKSDAADQAEEKNQEREDWASDPEGKAEEKAEEIENSWWGQLGLSAIPDDLKEKGKEILSWLKDKILGGAKKLVKSFFSEMAASAASAAGSGGVASFINGLGKLYKGVTAVMKVLRPSLQAAAEPAEIKSEIEKEGGEEQFWAQGTDREAEVDKEKKESKNEVLLRQVVREALLRRATR